MFSILRFILIIGVIFYFSPVRQQGDGLVGLLNEKKSNPENASTAPPAADPSDRLEAIWQALPDSAKQAVIDRILTTSGLSPMEAKPSDTLRSEDRQPEWRGDIAGPRT